MKTLKQLIVIGIFGVVIAVGFTATGLYNPALEPGVNALTLDAADLGASIASMLALGETEIARLSAAAAAYHREHLSLGRAIGAIGAFLADPDMPALDWYLAGKA